MDFLGQFRHKFLDQHVDRVSLPEVLFLLFFIFLYLILFHLLEKDLEVKVLLVLLVLRFLFPTCSFSIFRLSLVMHFHYNPLDCGFLFKMHFRLNKSDSVIRFPEIVVQLVLYHHRCSPQTHIYPYRT